jgi:hypothetical protein
MIPKVAFFLAKLVTHSSFLKGGRVFNRKARAWVRVPFQPSLLALFFEVQRLPIEFQGVVVSGYAMFFPMLCRGHDEYLRIPWSILYRQLQLRF